MKFIEERNLTKVQQRNILRRMLELKQNDIRPWAVQKRLGWAVFHKERIIGVVGYYIHGPAYEVFANFWGPPNPVFIRAIIRGLMLMPKDKPKIARVRQDNPTMQKVVERVGFKKWENVENFIVYREVR